MQTLILYAFGVGMPFAVLSANAPLIQSWYGRSGGPSADDPYFLYGASNLGSLISLLAFPLIAEPLFGITAIGKGWSIGFVALGAMLLACGLVSQSRSAASVVRPMAEAKAASAAPTAKPKPRDYATWALLAFIPSSLMLGVTAKISTDFGSFPMVWVIPLALYLLTFVVSFTNRPLFSAGVLSNLFRLSMAVLVVLAANLSSINAAWMNISLLIGSYFIISTMAHSKLFAARPSKDHLTLFYVTMSVGGAMGGVFNSILAPMLFNDIYELKVVVAVAAMLLVIKPAKLRAIDLGYGVLAGLIALLPSSLIDAVFPDMATSVKALAAAGILWAAYQYLAKRGFAPVIATYVVIVLAAYVSAKDVILRDRSFFGVHLVRDMQQVREYVQGTTIHGAERLADFGKRPTPIAYYIPSGPMGQIFLSDRGRAAKTVGIVGLGVGALSCYRQPGQVWDFYEIDKVMDDIARNPAYFTFMSSCAADTSTYLGDARIELEKQAGKTFDILVIDAYSSDAVPVHLTTVEAMDLYSHMLTPGGLLIFHISNRYFDIDVPLARSANTLGLRAWIQRYQPEDTGTDGQNPPSTVVAIAAAGTAAPDIAQDPRWVALQSDGGPVWTDDYANPLSILRAFNGTAKSKANGG